MLKLTASFTCCLQQMFDVSLICTNARRRFLHSLAVSTMLCHRPLWTSTSYCWISSISLCDPPRRPHYTSVLVRLSVRLYHVRDSNNTIVFLVVLSWMNAILKGCISCRPLGPYLFFVYYYDRAIILRRALCPFLACSHACTHCPHTNRHSLYYFSLHYRVGHKRGTHGLIDYIFKTPRWTSTIENSIKGTK